MENKKKLPLPIVIIIIGGIIGLLIAFIGIYKQVDSKRINNERREDALSKSQEMVDKANLRLKEIEEEYYSLKEQYEAKVSECDSILFGSDDWFTLSSKCKREEQELQSQLWDLESEDSKIKNKDYTVWIYVKF